ncbi:MAG: hypothetical protein WKF62_05605 [Solirubrobacterales bacterium]
MRRVSFIVVAFLALALWVPGQAQAFKPDIVFAFATDDNEGIRFTVKVRMDRGGRDKREVKVIFQGERKNADLVDNETNQSFYETGPYSASKKDCYPITVKATNKDGTTTRDLRAGRLGTDGCGKSRR